VRLRIGGVPEHFNLPWLLAIEERAFDVLDVELEWINYPGGTGSIMAALHNRYIDLATPLTEGAITSIAAGNRSRLARTWVDSPLLWGVHVASSSDAESVEDLAGQRFAISRFGSGSELMSLVMARDHGWTLTDDSWVVVGDLDGALAALPAGDAEIFLWSKSMTQPYVDSGVFKRVGVVETPWPSFSVAATDTLLEAVPGLTEQIIDIAAASAARLAVRDDAATLVADRYGLQLIDAAEWLDQVRWTPKDTPIDPQMLESVAAQMVDIGRIDPPVEVDGFLSSSLVG
jgi:ABC-type nitrate/sulfonate/bicarbonate transport system substrate-binding protein